MNGDEFRAKHRVSRPRYYAGLALAVVLVGAIAYLWGVRGIDFYLVPTQSMVPTLHPGDNFAALNAERYQRGDIVVAEDPEEEGAFVVKRLIGLGGDRIAIYGGALFLNGKYVSEPYVREAMNAQLEPYTVPEGKVFLLGDNRNESDDSLYWGRRLRAKEAGIDLSGEQPASFVPHADVYCPSYGTIRGKVRFIYRPAQRRGPVPHYPIRPVEYPPQD